ncbi:hypothetical protein DRQ09_09435 [candidate division KSB1 bacterium]|nr:MAG: hypothetical protein DRQ09_09435 [candidate division KSB1 bacterium]
MAEIIQIKVGKSKIGIIGLKEIFEKAKSIGNMTDEELKTWLIEEVRKENYVPDSTIDEYTRAVFREYKKFIGEKVEEEKFEGLEIKVLGPGCFSCDRLEKEIIKLLQENNIEADLEHVRDPQEIATYGIVGTPGLVINGVIKASGRIPKRKEILKWIEDAMKSAE